MWLFDKFKKHSASTIPVDETFYYPPNYDGSKFPGGLASIINDIEGLDYWSLRKRSAALFYTNTYARGIIRRFVTNVINTGLSVEVRPDEFILGVPEDSLVEWAEIIEKRFELWADNPELCDIKGNRNFGALQAQAYREALVEGDCLVVLRQSAKYNLPQIQIIPGSHIQTPVGHLIDRSVVDGVKLDDNGKQIGYFVDQGIFAPIESRFVYVPAYGPATGRLQAWMIYGIEKREDGIRGEPMLSIAIQPLKEIDKYRDAVQRKALINSMVAGFIKRLHDKPASLPIQSGGAKRLTTVVSNVEGSKDLTFAEVMPGMFMQRLQPGEEPVPYSTSGTDLNFGPFEAAIVCGLAWALEMPPEILTLGFEKSFSASQAANNEWKMFTDKEKERFGSESNDHVFQDWFLSELLLNKISAPGYLEAYVDAKQYDKKTAWTVAGWSGAVKPSVDMVKLVQGYKDLVAECWITNEKAARELTRTKFRTNVRRIKAENQMKLDAMQPILDAEKNNSPEQVARALRVVEGL